MGMPIDFAASGVTPQTFVAEVLAFRQAVADPALSADDRKRAYGLIVQHATLLNPQDRGYERAGVALMQAASSWLDAETH